MKPVKWIVLISLLLLLLVLGAFLLHPLVRFSINLYLDRFDRAESVYLSGIRDSERLDKAAREQLRRYVDQTAESYYKGELSYGDAMAVLSPLSQADLPQGDIAPAIQAIKEMETARTDLVQADASAAGSDYSRAIPLYRQSLIADEGAAYRLRQTEAAYKNSILDQAEGAMNAGEYASAEAVLLDGLSLLEDDEDLLHALEDVRRLQADEAYAATVEEARRLLREEGPEAAFRYAADLRDMAPDAYEYAYLEQLVRHEYEAEICSQAQALKETDPNGACNLLEEGLKWVDSEQMRSLHRDIRAAITYWLVDMPILRDETGNARTGAESTVARDQNVMDSRSNVYANSLWADLGSLTFSLADDFDAFTGTVAFPMGEMSDIYRSSATLQVYGDGMLIAEFKNMDADSAPLPFHIPVSGMSELTLRWTNEGANGWKDWGRFATIFDGRLIPPGGQ